MSEPPHPSTTPLSTTMSPDPNASIEDRKPPAINNSKLPHLQAKKTRVLVLGAGMAGLACARELQQRGYRVLVVEARDRPGGRLKGGVKTNDKEGGNEGIKTLPNSILSPDNDDVKPVAKNKKGRTSTAVDLGGALIHGIDSNPIYSLIQQMGIPTCPVKDCLLFDDGGWPIDTREDERISNLFNECLEETFDRVAKLDAGGSSQAGSDASKETTPQEGSTINKVVKGTSHEEGAVNTTGSQANPSGKPKDDAASASSQKAPPIQSPTEQLKQDEEKKESSPPALSIDNQDKANKEEKKEAASSQDNNNEQQVIRPRRAKAKRQDAAQKPPAEPDEIQTSSNSDGIAGKTAGSFGDVFDQVCREKGAPRGHPLFEWHQSNLEVSCGASFPSLGYKWNDDEPYGYDGAHVALKTSWKPVMETLAEGIDVLYQHAVKKIVLVVPDPPPEPPPPEPTEQPQDPNQQAALETTPTQEARTNPASSSSSKRKRKRTPTTAPPPPSRFSRRLRGDDADARRSSRPNKGQKVDRFLVNAFSRESYDDHGKLQSPRSARKGQHELEKEDVHTTVQVTLEDGTVLEAEAVVCTLPLGVLKLEEAKSVSKRAKKSVQEEENDSVDESAGAITFYPPLPERKMTAIKRLGCGLLNKCVLSFSHVFWQDSDFLGVAHPANSYLVLNAAKFTKKPILSFYYGGDFAKEIESWTDNEIVGDCMEVIRIICGRRDIPPPLDYVVTRWGHERYSRMSFSYVPPGVDGMEEFKAMSEAIYDPLVPRKPVLMFAGEHTTPFHPSTMHGAFLSGIREAYRLDLFVEAEANEYMEFEDDHIYQHTFAVRRLFSSNHRSPVARAPQPEGAEAEGTATGGDVVDSTRTTPTRRQHRRRGAATTVMNLRQRSTETEPNDVVDDLATRRQRRPQQAHEGRSMGRTQNDTFTPAKRSRRSVYAMEHQPLNGDATKNAALSTSKDAGLQKKQISSLESRTLMRALESYGHNYGYIQSFVLPVFGSGGATKSLPQVRARCQQMIRSILASASASIPKRVLASWTPKEVYVPPPPVPKKTQQDKQRTGRSSRARAPQTVAPSAAGTRRSSRQQRQRQVMDL